MKSQIATTKEQSARLLACGVSPDTADMCLSTRTRNSDGSFIAKKHQTTNLWVGYPCWRTISGDEELENIPAWSLSALLAVLPKEINRGNPLDGLWIEKSPASNHDWHISNLDSNNGDYTETFAPSLIEACVCLIEKILNTNNNEDKNSTKNL